MVEGVNGAKKQVQTPQNNVPREIGTKKPSKPVINFKYGTDNTNNLTDRTTGYNDLLPTANPDIYLSGHSIDIWTDKDSEKFRAAIARGDQYDIWTDEDSERFRAAIARGDQYHVLKDDDIARYRATLSPDERRSFDDMMAKFRHHRSYGDGKAVGQIPTGDIVNKPIDIDPDALKKIADELLAARNKLKEPGDDNIGSRLIDPGFEIPVNPSDDPGFKPVKEPLPISDDVIAKLRPKTPKFPEEPANTSKADNMPLSVADIYYARGVGSEVADFLVGYTNDFEQEQTILRLRDSVNNKNVMEFLSGYEENRGRGDHFFTQLSTEYGFEDKQKYLRDTASKLSVYLKANGQPDLAKEIDVILADGGVSKKDAAKLDEIVQVMLPTMQDLKQE